MKAARLDDDVAHSETRERIGHAYVLLTGRQECEPLGSVSSPF